MVRLVSLTWRAPSDANFRPSRHRPPSRPLADKGNRLVLPRLHAPAACFVALLGLTTGILTPEMWWHVLYYVVMIAIGLVFTTKRLRALFLD